MIKFNFGKSSTEKFTPLQSKRDSLLMGGNDLKKFRKPQDRPQIFGAGLSLPIVADTEFEPQPKSWRHLFRIVRPFVPTLRTGWHPYTSKGTKCGVGEFSGRCCEERFCPVKLQSNTEKSLGG